MAEETKPDEGRPLTYQERVAAEREALAPQVDRLHNFVNGAQFESVTTEEQQMLKSQLGFMQGYLNTLNARISLHKRQP